FYDHVGQVVTYTLTATNTGNTTLHAVTVSDSPVLAGFSCKVRATMLPHSIASLTPGASIVCTGTHSITQGDLDAGKFDDTASASSTEATATDANDEILASQTKTLHPSPTRRSTALFYDHVGQVVTYTLTATNTGNTTLHAVTVSDSPVLAGFSCKVGATVVTLPVASLRSEARRVGTGWRSLTQGDLDEGKFDDTASAASTEATATDANDEILASQTKTLGLTKADSLTPSLYVHVGHVVTYTLTATNTGNTTLHAVTVSDSPVLAGFSCKVGATVVTLPVASL